MSAGLLFEERSGDKTAPSDMTLCSAGTDRHRFPVGMAGGAGADQGWDGADYPGIGASSLVVRSFRSRGQPDLPSVESMTARGHDHVVPVVIALLAVLLPAAVLAVTTVDRQAPVRVEALGPAGFGMTDIDDEDATVASSAAPAVSTPANVPPPLPVTTTVVRRATTTTTALSVTRDPAPTPPSTPPSAGPTTAVTTVPRASSWSASQNGIGLRMRMEPTAPQAGDPVTFFVELSPIDACCIGALSFGDESSTPLSFEGRCKYSQGTVQKVVATHTFAAAGAYKVVASAATVPCSVPSPAGDGSLTIMGFPVGVTLHACVVVGPGKAGCSP